MVNAAKHKRDGRIRRHNRLRRKIHGTGTRPRLAVFDLTVIFLLRLSMMRKGKLSFLHQVLNQKYDQETQGPKRRQQKSGSLLERGLNLLVFLPLFLTEVD